MKIFAISVILFLMTMPAVSRPQTKITVNRPGSSEKLKEKDADALYKKTLKEDGVPKGAIELELIAKVPLDIEVDEKEIYFKNMMDFSVDRRGHVYAPDSFLKVVYEFDKNGKLRSKYAKAGQGPGEMNWPAKIFFHENKILLHESVLQKLVYYDREWKYLRSISMPGYIPFGIAPNGDIYNVDYSRKKLVAVSDSNGKILRHMGEPPYPQKSKSTLNTITAGLSPSGSVWVCFTALGIIHKYSMSGKLLKEIDFRENMSDLLKKSVSENMEYDRKGKSQWIPVFVGIAFLGEDILITGGGVANPIYRLDDEGHVKAVFFIKPEYRNQRECQFAAVNENNEELFFIRTEIGDSVIGVYRRKRQDVSK